MKWRMTCSVIYSTYGRDTCMRQKNLGEHQYPLYLLGFKINYFNIYRRMYHVALYTKARE